MFHEPISCEQKSHLMETKNLKEHYAELIERMVADGYDKGSLYYVKGCIQFVLCECCGPDIPDYESAFRTYAALKGYTENRHAHEACKVAMGHVRAFDLEGRFPSKGTRCNQFLKPNPSSYCQLNDCFKAVIDDYCRKTMSTSNKRDRTVRNESSMASTFLFHCQKQGADDLESITVSMTRNFFFDGTEIVRGKDCWYLIMNVLKGTCRGEWFAENMTAPKRRKKSIDFLKKEEVKKIAEVLHDLQSPLNPLDRAVGNTLFHLGIRGTDIMKLDFSNIDWRKNEIRIMQSKTGVPLMLPLLPSVGNAILDYLREQRGKGGSTVFLMQTGPARALMSLSTIVNRIFDAAGVRTREGHRGVRLFRHQLATYLITHGVEGQVVSSILGHESPTSLEAYVDLDLEGLRECCLSIDSMRYVSDIRPVVDVPEASGRGMFVSPLAGQLEAYLQESGRKSSCRLISFDRFCAKYYPDAKTATEDMMQSWCTLRPGESEAYRKQRTSVARMFASFSNDKGWTRIPTALILPAPIRLPEGGCGQSTLATAPARKPYVSLLAPHLSEFEESRRAADRWSGSYSGYLHTFDNHCMRNHPGEAFLTDGMLEWCRERPTECRDSCCARTYVVWSFAEYSNRRGWSAVTIVRPSTGVRRNRTPHYFTDDEIDRFLDACVDYFTDYIRPWEHITSILYRLQYPVFVLLLLSSGIRTCEARWLHIKDFDREYGYLDIRRSKQSDEHRVPLSPSMTGLLCRYDDEMSKIMPGRTVFFPRKDGGYHDRRWQEKYFHIIWPTVSTDDARLYDLRNTFATRNISSFEGRGMEFEEKIIRLSRAMGHANIDATFGYFTRSEMLDEKLRKKSDGNLAELMERTRSRGKKDE